MQALTLAGGDATWASHDTAAHLHRFLDAPRPQQLDVLVPRDRHAKLADHRLHTARALGEDEVTEVDGIPCTTVARTLLDLAVGTDPGTLERYAAHQVRGRRGLADELLELTDRHRWRPGRRRLLDVLARLPGDAAKLGSALEVIGVQRLRELGAPPFVLQYEVCDADGAYLKRVDVAWPQRWTIVEFDGAAYHDLTAMRRQDEAVRSRLRSLGWHVEVVRRADLHGAAFAGFVRRLAAR